MLIELCTGRTGHPGTVNAVIAPGNVIIPAVTITTDTPLMTHVDL